ncbi:MAG: hypothetical protein OSA97_05195, partial [Nevskia sp.]|nr:hypothetical protein [Nevskia sp.]
MGIAKESTGSYQMGFATFGVLSAAALTLVVLLRQQWLVWAVVEPAGGEVGDAALEGAVHAE